MDHKTTMAGWQLTGHGGFDRLTFRTDLPVPEPAADEVLIAVGASSVNNTDINTRIGWYSKSVRGGTDGSADSHGAPQDGGWAGALAFPRIQGADCCGTIVATGAAVDASRVGERVLVRTMQVAGDRGADPAANWTFGSEEDGGFAQYATARSRDALAISCDWTDAELGTIPCAYSTAEAMLQRAGVGAERILITGASGGVGSAAVQLATRHGAQVVALTSPAKADAVRALGAERTLSRDDALPAKSFDVVVDLVAGPRFPDLLEALKVGGRYVTSGAIAGPIVELDVRTLYLADLTLYGSTVQPERILPDLIAAIEAGAIRPLVAATYALSDLIAAQKAFLDKSFVGKIALTVDH